jgi:hypothetical protein
LAEPEANGGSPELAQSVKKLHRESTDSRGVVTKPRPDPRQRKDFVPRLRDRRARSLQQVRTVTGDLRGSVNRERPVVAVVEVTIVRSAYTLGSQDREDLSGHMFIKWNQIAISGNRAHEWVVEYNQIVLFGQMPDRIAGETLERARLPLNANSRMRLGEPRGRCKHRSKTAIVLTRNSTKSNHATPQFETETRNPAGSEAGIK